MNSTSSIVGNYISPFTCPMYLFAANRVQDVALTEIPRLVISVFETILVSNVLTLMLTALTP